MKILHDNAYVDAALEFPEEVRGTTEHNNMYSQHPDH